MQRASQCDLILAHLQAGGTISQMEAYRRPFRCGRLASRIHDLNKQGYGIQKRMERVGGGAIVARYFLP